MFTKLILTFLSLALVQPIFGDSAQTIESLLQEAQRNAKETPLGWKKIAIQTSTTLDSYDAQAVTRVLYARLKPDKAGRNMQTIVSRIAHTTKAFSPDVWLSKLGDEQDPFILMAGMLIFQQTEYKADNRFKALLKNSLKDTRVGRGLIGEERAYSDEGLRICDRAYNLLMSDRKGSPPEHPLGVIGDTKKTRDKKIMKLCEELNVAGPLSPYAEDSPSPTRKTSLSEKTRQQGTLNALSSTTSGKLPIFVSGGLIALLIGFVVWMTNKRK